MALIHDLIKQIADETLRQRIMAEVDKLSKQKKFGLVFEEHLPECTPLYDVEIRKNSKVALKTGQVSDIYIVRSINGDKAICEHKIDHAEAEFALDDLVAIAEFGEPIYPYLQPIDAVCNAPDSELWHTLIEADNYHALQFLEYLYAGKVDCIYIDPPYNTGIKEWKYNDEYVDSNDTFYHSKWLSFIKRRLLLSKKLISYSGVIMISIGYQELNRLMLLCKEIFPEKQVVFSVVKTSGGKPKGGFNFANEYVVFITGDEFSPNSDASEQTTYSTPFHGMNLATFTKSQRPNQAYPIYVRSDGVIIGCGKSLAERIEEGLYTGDKADFEYDYSEAPKGTSAVWPITKKGEQCVWRLIPTRLKSDWKKGYIKVTPVTNKKNKNRFTIQYLSEGIISKIESGELPKEREYPNTEVPTLKLSNYKTDAGTMPTLLTNKEFYTANGNNDLSKIFQSKAFPYPKPLHFIRYLLGKTTKRNSLIIDFFAGSGTTLNAVNLLNAEDGGNRRCIMVTNNDLSDKEAKKLVEDGYKPGDMEWENLGIARYVTWPRTVCSIMGHDVKGFPLNGDYGVQIEKFVKCNDDDLDEGEEKKGRNVLYKKVKEDVYPKLVGRKMSDGFAANAAFFKLGFLDKAAVRIGKQFREMLPTLWMKAGCFGPCPSLKGFKIPDYMVLSENHMAILNDNSCFAKFAEEIENSPKIETVYLVTDSDDDYRSMVKVLNVKNTYQLYKDYLDNFRINSMR